MASIDYRVTDNWGSGFIGEIKVRAGVSAVHGGWIIEFDAPFAIANLWNAEIVSRVGDHYVIRNAAWNGSIAAGQEITLGFQAAPQTPDGATTATGFAVNGSGTTPPPPPVLPTLAVGDATVSEGNSGSSDLAFTVSLSAPSTVPVTVSYVTSNGTAPGSATAGSDFAAASGTLTFAPGETSKVVHVAVTGDSAVESNETVTLALSNVSGATIADGTAAGTIVNDDVAPPPPPPPPASGINVTYTVDSNWGSGFTGSMTVKAGDSVLNGWTVEFDSTIDITGIWNAVIVSHTGNHYVVRNADWNGTVAANGSTSFGFQASPGSGGTAAGGFAVNGVAVGVPPPPALPSLSVADATGTEGHNGSSDLAFTVTLSAASTAPVTVAYATANGTATAGSDFTASSGTLTFAPGETSKVVHVQVTGDNAVETAETLTLTLSAASGATIADGTAIGTIVNDDVAPPPPVTPTVSINDVTVAEGNPGSTGGGSAGWFSTSGNQIVDANGQSVQIAGVNWFGFESDTMSPHGLWARNWKDMMDQMVEQGFNTIRLPFSNEMLHSTATPGGIDFFKNADLQGLTSLQIMDRIVAYAGEIGLRIILDHHRSEAGVGVSGNGLWYEGSYTEAGWIADWQMLASRYAGNPTVIGADLHNEPHNGHWGSDGGAAGDATDWAAAAERAGNAIGTVNPNWLIFVEGVETYQGQNYWWGGNLMGVRDRPIDLAVNNKLVYSAHDYPNSVWQQPWFQDANFAQNLPAKFDQMWGYIFKQGIAPVFIGEFGTNLVDPKDAPWLEAITSYLSGDFDNNGTIDLASGQTGPSWTFWSWNPNSGDTGGILAADWQTVNQNKMAYLTPIQFEFSDDAPGDGGDSAGPIATFTVTLSAPATGTVTVDYHTVAGDGSNGAGTTDFEAKTGTVTFAAGETSKTVSIQVNADLVDEVNESFSVVLGNVHGAAIADGTGVAIIVDDDTTVALPPPPPPPPPPTTTGEMRGTLSVTDSWSSGFGANVVVHNDGVATGAWQIQIDMPNLITDIWNAKIVSHFGNTYVIGGASWNLGLGQGGETSFGFTASGAYNASAVSVHRVGPLDDPSVPSGLAAHDTDQDSTVLSWNAATPGEDPLTGYAVFVNGQQVATTTATSYEVTGLDPATTYQFAVKALDADGASPLSAALAVRTHALPGEGGADGREFTPYIDMAMDQGANLLGIAHASGIDNFTLAFVLGSSQGIGWQGVGTIADDTLYNGTTILQQVQAIQAEGGNITISFGGAAGTEAALLATSASQLQALYQGVIDRYGVTSIDFDIEGHAVMDTASVALRNQAIKGLQDANPDLQVSFTLPVLPTGLVQSGLDLLASAKAAGVRVDLVNIMAMDYGASVDNNGQMGVSAIQASEATQAQLQQLGIDAKIGITPMIGVNDIASEVFTLADAQMLLDYAMNDPDVGRLSMWSVARDNGSGAGSPWASPTHSGVQQDLYDFAEILQQFDHDLH